MNNINNVALLFIVLRIATSHTITYGVNPATKWAARTTGGFVPLCYVFATFHGWETTSMNGHASDASDAFDAIADELSELRIEASAEHLGEAHEILAAGVAQRAFRDELRRIQTGDVVTVVGTDGVALRGRILRVGADWMRLGEVTDESGSRRARLLRVHDLRLDAVVRVTREGDR
jgi:hypothetical protein